MRSRRSLLRVTAFSVATTLVGWQAIERLTPAVRLRTGSKQTASLSANAFPAEIWLFDQVPTINAQEWRLAWGAPLQTSVSLAELTALHPRREVQCVLDCTSGWWSEQVWSGVGLLDVLGTAGLPGHASQVAVESLTGHRIVLALADLETAVLVTHVGGEPLSRRHGFPFAS